MKVKTALLVSALVAGLGVYGVTTIGGKNGDEAVQLVVTGTKNAGVVIQVSGTSTPCPNAGQQQLGSTGGWTCITGARRGSLVKLTAIASTPMTCEVLAPNKRYAKYDVAGCKIAGRMV